MYLWDHDYRTICKFFQENLGEQPQTVIPDQELQLKNENTWCFIDIRLNKTVAKLFQGEREDYINYYHNNFCNKNMTKDITNSFCRCKENVIMNNEASIGELEIKDLIYRFYMQEYGGKIMKLYVGNINLDDNRKNSKLTGKKIMYDLNLAEFNIFDEMSTFDQNVEENNIIFQNIDEENQGMEGSSSSDEMDIHENFDQIDEVEDEAGKEDSATEQSIDQHSKKQKKPDEVSPKKLNLKSKESKKRDKSPQNTPKNGASKSVKSSKKDEKKDSNQVSQKASKYLNNSVLNQDKNKKSENSSKKNDKEDHGQAIIIPENPQTNQPQESGFQRFWRSFKEKISCSCLRKKKPVQIEVKQIDQNIVQGQAELQKDNVLEPQQPNLPQQQKNHSNSEEHKLNQIGSENDLDNENDKAVQFQSHMDPVSSDRQDANMFSSQIKKRINSMSSSKEVNQDFIESNSIERDWPTDDYPKRKIRIEKLADTLKKTIANPNNDYEDLQNEYDLLFKPHEKNKCDFRFIFRSRPDGEKLIKMIIENKTIYLAIDQIVEVVTFFRKPYNGSDFQPNVKQCPIFNNFPQMTVEIKAQNLMCFTKSEEVDSQSEKPAAPAPTSKLARQGTVFLNSHHNNLGMSQNLGKKADKENKESSNQNPNQGSILAFFLDSKYTHKWKGDSYFGPGSVKISVDTDIKKAFIIQQQPPNQNVGSPNQRSGYSSRPSQYMNFPGMTKKKSMEGVGSMQNNVSGNISNISRDSILNVPQAIAPQKSKQPSKSQYYNPSPSNNMINQGNGNVLEQQTYGAGTNNQNQFNYPNFPTINSMNYSNNASTQPTMHQTQNTLNQNTINQTSPQQQPIYQQQNQIQTIVENIKLTFETTYEVDFIRKKDSAGNNRFNSNQVASMKDKIAQQKQFDQNQHSYRKTNISLSSKKRGKSSHQASVTTLAKLQKIFKNMMLPTASPQAIPYIANVPTIPSNPFFDYNVVVLSLKVEKFHFEILKNNFGVKILSLKFDDIYAKKISKLNNSIFGLKGQISIDYFNKRRITYEPLLEPWVFMVRQERIGNSHNLTIQNFESKKDENMLPLLKEHHNSFNLNFSLSCLETIMEAYRIYKGTMTDEEPYLIINKSGLSIEIKDSNKETSLPQEVSNSQKIKWQGWKEVYGLHKSKQQQKINETKAVVNLNIINPMNNNTGPNTNVFNIANQLIQNMNQANSNLEFENRTTENIISPQHGLLPSGFRREKKAGETFEGQIQEISEENQEKQSPMIEKTGNLFKFKSVHSQNDLEGEVENLELHNNQSENIDEAGRMNTQGSNKQNFNLKLAIRQVSNVGYKDNNTQESYVSNNNLLNIQQVGSEIQTVQFPSNNSVMARQMQQMNKSNSYNLNYYNPQNNNEEEAIYSLENEESKTNDNKSNIPRLPLEKTMSTKSENDKLNLGSVTHNRKTTYDYKISKTGQSEENMTEMRPRKTSEYQLNGLQQSQQLLRGQKNEANEVDFTNENIFQKVNNPLAPLNSPGQSFQNVVQKIKKKQMQVSTFKTPNLNQTTKNPMNISSKNRSYLFRQIKRIQLDHVGKILIPLKLDKNELLEKKKAQENTLMLKAKNQQQLKQKKIQDSKHKKQNANIMNSFLNNLNSLQKNINKLGQELINTLLNKKVNESGKTYLLVDNKLNPQTGSKEITISSSVKFFNNLSRKIVIEFQTELEIGNQKKQNQFHIVEENSFFEVPLDQLEACALVRLFPYLESNDQEIPFDLINIHYEFVLLSQLIKDKTSYNDYDVDEEDIVSDILKDQIQGINIEKGSRLIFKEDYEVNPHMEKSDQKSPQKNQTLDDGRDHPEELQVTKSHLIHFVVTCVKTKHNATYSLSEKEFGFETTLIINPIFKFVNATVNIINIDYGFNIPLSSKSSSSKNHKRITQLKHIPPKCSLECTSSFFSEDLQIKISYQMYNQTKELKVFSKKEQKYKIDLRFESNLKKSIILYLDVIKLSQKSREIVLYCPYLILNNTGFKELKIREFGLTTNIDSHQDDEEEFQFFKKSRSHAPNTMISQLPGSSKKIPTQLMKNDTIGEGIAKGNQKYDLINDIRNQTKLGSVQDLKHNQQSSYIRNEQDTIRMDFQENDEEVSRLKQLRMFSTSKTMNKIQIGLCPKDIKDREKSNWSQPISLQTADGVFVIKDKKSDYRNQFEFGLTIESAPGFWNRSKIICITPRYMVRNESNYDLVLKQNKPSWTQKDLSKEECRLDGTLDSSKVSVMSFFWTDYKLPQECVIQLLGQRISEESGPVFQSTVTNKFRVDRVGDISVKIKFDPEMNSDEEFQYLKVSIQLEENIFIITIMNEDKMNPPFFIDNQTKHEIYYGQHIEETKKFWCLKRKKQQMKQMSTQVLYPGEKKKFTWDEWVVENDHILGVEIENETIYYNIDKIKDYPPIKIRESADELNKKKTINKKFLYKKGKIRLKYKAQDSYITRFIILDVYQQKMKVYDEKKEVAGEVINLKGANIEDARDQQFVLIKGNSHFYFDSSTEKEAKEWTEYLWRAILLTTPDLVQFKIEPMEKTKVLCFYQVKYEDEMNQQKENQQGDLNNDNLLLDKDDDENQDKDKAQTTFIFRITNTVGISFIDNIPKEILQVSFKNLNLIYSLSNEQEDKIRKNILEDIDNPGFVQNNNITRNHTSMIGNTQQFQNTIGNNPQNTTTIQQTTQNPNQQSIQHDQQSPENQKIIANQRALLSFMVDSIIINNQIENAQFPVLLAPTKRKTGDPFFMISILWKNHVQKNNQSKHQRNKLVSYIHQTSFYIDTIEIRIDDHILDTIISYFNQVRNILSIQNTEINELKLYDYDELEDRLSYIIENQKKNNQILNYIKNLRVEPIDICFTFRSSPGHSLTASTKNIIGDFGLTLASIDQAKIKLSQLLMTHIFGSIKDIFTKITKHFSQQFMRQLYKLLGSFDFLGNPVSLIENLGTSVVDMLYQPFYALVKGKSGYKFGEKFAIGAVNLISSSISGVYKTVNKIIGTIMKLLASMTLHKQYIHARQIRLNRTIKNVKEGIIIGLKNFFIDLWQTLTGIIRRPIAEAKSGGLLGLFKGVYQAFVSLFIRPTVAMYDLITTIIQGLQNTAQYEEHIMDTRSRPIRQFGDNKVLIPYEFKTAIGMDIIKRYKLKLFEHETVLFFDELIIKKGKKKNIESQIILSDIRIVYVKKHSSIAYKKIMLHKIKRIQYEESVKKMKIKMHVPVKRVCVGQKYDIYLKYESKERAQLLLDAIIKYQGSSQIPQFDVKLD